MNSIQLDLRLPNDSLGFVRRECPHCRRQFKTRRRAFDGRVLMRRLGAAVTHENAQDIQLGLGERFSCFYCGKVGPADDFLTADQKEFVERLSTSLVEHLRFEQLSQVVRTLSDNPRPTFVPVRPAAMPAGMPGELEDMRPFPLTCCNDEVKAAAGWNQPFHCPACGVRHARGGAPTHHKLQLTFVRE
ncbi:MAG: hypothetical protein M3Y59_11690 [Myxococcota bacterium]|nr:hypothetical protein [Myxococcota bacterium]